MLRVPGLGAVLEDRAAVRRGPRGGQRAETRAESPAPAQALPWVESAPGTQWDRVTNQGGAGKGSFQREKNEGHWARAQEGPPLYSECREGRGVPVGLWWRGRDGERSVLCRAGRSGQAHWMGGRVTCRRGLGTLGRLG